jgi:hypothetical protein
MELSKLTSLLLTNSAPLTKPSLFRSRSYEPTARPPAPPASAHKKPNQNCCCCSSEQTAFRPGPDRSGAWVGWSLVLVVFALYFELEYEGRGNLTLDIPRRITACFGPRTLLCFLLLPLLGLRWVDPDCLTSPWNFLNLDLHLRSKGVRY